MWELEQNNSILCQILSETLRIGLLNSLARLEDGFQDGCKIKNNVTTLILMQPFPWSCR